MDRSQPLLAAPPPPAWPTRLRRVVGGRGDLQHLADRLDPEPPPVPVDVGDHFLRWRSSSAPKKAAAVFKISLARRSSLFSRSSSTIPGPLRTDQTRSVSRLDLMLDDPPPQRLPVDPQLRRDRSHAAVAHPRSSRHSRTKRTARPRNSSGYTLGRPIDSILPAQNGASVEPGALHARGHRERAHRTRAEKPLRCGACVPSARSDGPEFQRRTI